MDMGMYGIYYHNVIDIMII